MLNKVTIVGIDPGITTGIAIIDIHGNLLDVFSKRSMRRSEIIKVITNFGQPLILSCDVNPPPKSVEKIVSILGCKIFYPKSSISMLKKERLVKWSKIQTKNKHETDSLSACLMAWKRYRPFFIKIENRLQKMGFSKFSNEVISSLIKNESKNIENALNSILSKKM